MQILAKYFRKKNQNIVGFYMFSKVLVQLNYVPIAGMKKWTWLINSNLDVWQKDNLCCGI